MAEGTGHECLTFLAAEAFSKITRFGFTGRSYFIWWNSRPSKSEFLKFNWALTANSYILLKSEMAYTKFYRAKIKLSRQVPDLLDVRDKDFTANILNTEAKRNLATHSHLAVEITDPKRHLKLWSEMWLTLLKIRHQLSIKSLFEKINMRQVPVHRVSDSKVLKFQLCLFRLHFFAAKCSISLHSKQR